MNERKKERLTIRLAESHDAAEIAAIYNHYILDGVATFDTEMWEAARAEAMVNAADPYRCFVAELNGRTLAGWVAARRYSDRPGYRHTCETSIYVSPDHSGCGIGQRLYQQLDGHCRRHAIHHAVARISMENPQSIAFHHRCGFETVGIQREVGWMQQRWVDVAILQKIYRD